MSEYAGFVADLAHQTPAVGQNRRALGPEARAEAAPARVVRRKCARRDASRRALRRLMGAGSQMTSRYAEQVAMVKDELAAQNRDPETFRFGKRVNVHVEEDPRIARTLDYALRHHYGGGEWADHMLAGTAKECVAGIRAVADAGADLILLNPLVPQLFRGAGGDPALKNIDALGWPSTIAGHCSRLQSLENRVCMGPDLSV